MVMNNSDRIARIRIILSNPFAEYPGLTDREQEILTLAAKGKTSTDIAEAMSMSEKAITSTLYRLKPRIGKTKPELVQHLIEQLEGVLE